MSPRLRVFVSSTMEDLANEREAVVDAIKDFNFEPVNAEGILPDGGTSWNVLEHEIRTCHICILIQGDRYGWIPTEGYGAGTGKSVTHLEVDVARQDDIPVLPFFKKLKYGTDSTNDDAVRRDKFRKEIGDWKTGLFFKEFNLASDLRKKVLEALVKVLVDAYYFNVVNKRTSKMVSQSYNLIEFANLWPVTSTEASASPEILFAGAGLSLGAGYPSANALASVIGQALKFEPDKILGYGLSELFEAADTILGREGLLSIVTKLVDPPLPVGPTPAHVAAVRRFPIIVTTNYDQLFERACEFLKLSYAVRAPGQYFVPNTRPAITIFKIDGSIEHPESLVLTSSDADRARQDNIFWDEIGEVLRTHRPIVVGHSMRDATSLSLLGRRNLEIRGVYVAPAIHPIDGPVLLNRFNLEGIESSADEYLWKALK